MNFSSTKERIIYESLRLFSEKGYDGVSMREIAAAVEIKAASLYAHFQGKEAILQGIIDTVSARYENQAMELSLDGKNPEADAAVYAGITPEGIKLIGKQFFLFSIHDEYTKMYRKLLTMEQYKSPEIAKILSNEYFDGPLIYQKQMLGLIAKQAGIKDGDYEVMALNFFGPIFMLITLCDREPNREAEALDLLERHVNQFMSVYLK